MSNAYKSIRIAGIGAVCCAGVGVEQGFRAVTEGRSGLAPLSLFDSRLRTAPLVAQVNSSLDRYISESDGNKTLAMALCAADEATVGNEEVRNRRLGLVFATTVAGIARSELFYENLKRDPQTIRSAARELAMHEATALSGVLAEHCGACGFHTISTACSTGLHAVGMAKRLVEEGIYDACLAIGSDALSMLTVRGFASLTLLDPAGCRPFDIRRAGISLGEGAGALLLTSDKITSKPTGVRVCGWGATADCHHMTAPHPDGAGALRAITAALQEANCAPESIDLIAAHGTGTPDNDKAEACALAALCKTVPPVCSMKRTLGHTLAASGILEAVFAVRAIQEGIIPPTAGYEHFDPEVGLEPSAFGRAQVRTVLKNSFGFGGNNAAVIFSSEKGE